MLPDKNRILDRAAALRGEMQQIVRSAAEPVSPGASVKAALQQASRRLGLSYSRIRSFWYAQADAWAHEADQLRAWRQMSDLQREQRLREELMALQARIGQMNAGKSNPVAPRVFSVERRTRPGLGGWAGAMDRRQATPAVW